MRSSSKAAQCLVTMKKTRDPLEGAGRGTGGVARIVFFSKSSPGESARGPAALSLSSSAATRDGRSSPDIWQRLIRVFPEYPLRIRWSSLIGPRIRGSLTHALNTPRDGTSVEKERVATRALRASTTSASAMFASNRLPRSNSTNCDASRRVSFFNRRARPRALSRSSQHRTVPSRSPALNFKNPLSRINIPIPEIYPISGKGPGSPRSERALVSAPAQTRREFLVLLPCAGLERERERESAHEFNNNKTRALDDGRFCETVAKARSTMMTYVICSLSKASLRPVCVCARVPFTIR